MVTPSGGTPLVAGTRLGAELCLERPLVEGRPEGVWLARRTSPEGHETEVAVKLLGGRDADAALRERLGREAVALAGLAHPHVVRALGRGATGDGVPFLVMELCRGETLRERILRSALPLDEAARVVGELCAALGSVHAAALVHRDVRPEHVLLEAPAGRVKLVGFASAPPVAGASASGASSPSPTSSGAVAPSYQSPERIREPGADDVDGDLWSVGAVAYEMVTGRPAFAGTAADGVARSVCEGRFARPGALGLPAALDGFFARAFAPERAARFHSAHDLGVGFAHAVLLALAEQSARAASLASEIALSVPIVVAPPPSARGASALAPATSGAAPAPPGAAAPPAAASGSASAAPKSTLLGFAAPARGDTQPSRVEPPLPEREDAAVGPGSEPSTEPRAAARERLRAVGATVVGFSDPSIERALGPAREPQPAALETVSASGPGADTVVSSRKPAAGPAEAPAEPATPAAPARPRADDETLETGKPRIDRTVPQGMPVPAEIAPAPVDRPAQIAPRPADAFVPAPVAPRRVDAPAPAAVAARAPAVAARAPAAPAPTAAALPAWEMRAPSDAFWSQRHRASSDPGAPAAVASPVAAGVGASPGARPGGLVPAVPPREAQRPRRGLFVRLLWLWALLTALVVTGVVLLVLQPWAGKRRAPAPVPVPTRPAPARSAPPAPRPPTTRAEAPAPVPPAPRTPG